ncbi:MAG: glycosyltransferase family 1 protein [Sterolibacterium sp.]
MRTDSFPTAGSNTPEPKAGAGLTVALVTETFPPEVNGVAMTLGRLVDGLRRRGHAVRLVRPRQHADDTPRTAAGFSETLVAGLPIPGYQDLRFGLPATGKLLRLWRRERPDIVHVATEGPLGWAAVRAARKLGLPVTSGFHTHFEAYSRHYGIGWMIGPIRRYLRMLHNRTDATLVPTRELASSLGMEGYRGLTVVSRGVDTAQFSPRHREPGLRAEWGATADELVVIHVGRLAPEKNLPLVLRAFNEIRRVRAEARLVLVGDGPLRKTLERDHPDCILAGTHRGEDLARHYASADLFLFPSLTETFGNVIPEALASGLAIVAYDRAAATDLIVNGVSGAVAPPGNEAAFIGAAVAIACDPTGMARLRAIAPVAVAHLDWDNIHDAFAATLHRVAMRHGQRRAGEQRLAAVPD